MAIILQGDKSKAATWVPWAKNQLQRLKSISSIVNQIYRPAVGVGIHVRSGAGIDSLRIVVAIRECNLILSMEALGSKQVRFDFIFNTKDVADFYRIEFDTGGKFLTGGASGLRYGALSLVRADIGTVKSTTGTFLNTGTYTINAFAQKNQNLVTHSTPVIDVPDFEVDLDMGGITRASTQVIVLSFSRDPVEVYINDVLIGTTNDGTRANSVREASLEILPTMNIRCVALGLNIRQVAIIFREYKCQATTTNTITVT